MLMTRHVDGNGRIEESEFHELLEEIAFQQKRRDKRSKAFLAEESSVSKPWLVPPEGHLRLELEYQRLHNRGSHTSLESTDGLVEMLLTVGDGHADVLTHALSFISLNVEQGMRMYTTLRTHMGGDKIKALAKVIPRMESQNEARLLKNSVLRDIDERRKLRHELGPAYRPLMGTPMGHFELDLAKPMHRLAAQKILECNNLEKLARQSRVFSVFDVSQRGDWNNTRNETLNGKPCRLKGTILDELPQAGTLGIDFTSSTRPESRSCHGAATVSRTKPMSTRKFFDFLRALGLGNDETWAGVVEVEVNRGLDRLVDKALHESPPRQRTRKMFEHLHFLNTGEHGHAGNKEPIPLRPSAMDKHGNGGGSKQSPPRRHSVMYQQQQQQQSQHFSHKRSSMTQNGDGPGPKSMSHIGRPGSSNKHSRPATAPFGTGLRLRSTVGINTMACRLDELMADSWFSIRQCRFIVLAMQEAHYGDEFLQDVIVDFVVTVFPRIVDVFDYLTLVGCLEDRSQAFVIKRVGWLAAWNPCRPEGYMEMALDLREERQVAKMLIHLAFDHHGDEHWTSSSFRWAMFDTPIPGWMLPVVWHTEEGLPHKGILACTHARKPGSHRLNWMLRVALAQVVSLGGAPPTSDIVVTDKEVHALIGEGETKDGRDTGSTSTSTDTAGHKGADILDTAPGLKGSDVSFDRGAVDALCRQAASDFFLYGAQHSSITTPA